MKFKAFHVRIVLIFISVLFASIPSFSDDSGTLQALKRIEDSGLTFKMTDTSVLQLPIARFATENIDSTGKTPALWQFPGGLWNTLQTLQAEEGHILVDCAVFVQIAALILTGEIHQSSAFLFAHGQLEALIAPIIFNSDFGYVTQSDNDAYRLIRTLPVLNKGQWVVKVAPDSYIGLVRRGVIAATEAEWVDMTKRGLLQEIDHGIGARNRCVDLWQTEGSTSSVSRTPTTLSQTDLISFQTSYLSLLRELGKLDDWRMHQLSPPKMQELEGPRKMDY